MWNTLLEDISKIFYSISGTLRRLTISSNNLRKLQNLFHTSGSNIEYLDVSNNSISSIQYESFEYLKDPLEWFNASQNLLPFLNWDVTEKLSERRVDLSHNEWKCSDCRIYYLARWLNDQSTENRPLLNCTDRPTHTYVHEATLPAPCYFWFWLVILLVIGVIICMCCCGCLLVFNRLSKFGEEKSQVTPVTNPDECFPEEKEDHETSF